MLLLVSGGVHWSILVHCFLSDSSVTLSWFSITSVMSLHLIGQENKSPFNDVVLWFKMRGNWAFEWGQMGATETKSGFVEAADPSIPILQIEQSVNSQTFTANSRCHSRLWLLQLCISSNALIYTFDHFEFKVHFFFFFFPSPRQSEVYILANSRLSTNFVVYLKQKMQIRI